MCHTFDEFTCRGVIDGHMVAGVVGAELVVHRSLGMFHRNVIEVAAAAVFGCPEQHLQIYHVVHDGVVSAKHLHVARPRKDGAHSGIEQCGE